MIAMGFSLAMGAAQGAEWAPTSAPLMTRWAKEVTPENAWQVYPRPQLEREKWQNLNGYTRTVDLVNGRMRVRQRQSGDFVFAAARNMRGIVTTQGIDGDVAFNIGADGRATRANAAAARARDSAACRAR